MSQTLSLFQQPDDFMYDGILIGNGMADNPLRDLSAWRVTVPGVIGQPEYDNPKKLFYSYLIDIRRVDIMEGVVLQLLIIYKLNRLGENIKIYLYFQSFSDIGRVHVVEILPHGRHIIKVLALDDCDACASGAIVLT